jgi:hypothetical protein
MKCLVVIALIAALGACGASAAEVKAAQTATYRAPPNSLFQIALQATQEDYKIGDAAPELGTFITAEQWYSPEGGRQSFGAGDVAQVSDRSVNLMLVVEITELDEGRFAIKVTPKTLQYVSGSPKPRELAPDDPNLPGWVQGRVEALQVRIHNAAKQYQAGQ